MAKHPSNEVDLFKKANISAVQRVLARARAKEDQANQKPKIALNLRRGLLSKALDMAVAHHGRSSKNRPSIRMLAPGTGGRPYHFGFTTVSKGSRSKPGAAGTGTGPSSGSGGSGPSGKSAAQSKKKSAAQGPDQNYGREAAHQKYTERDSAVERDKTPVDPDLLEKLRDRDPDRNRDIPENGLTEGRDKNKSASIEPDSAAELAIDPTSNRQAGQQYEKLEHDEALDVIANPAREPWPTTPEENQNPGPEQTQEPQPKRRPRHAEEPMTALEFVEEGRRHQPDIASTSTEAAAQAYIESAEKVPKLMGTTSSFGTIGATLEERMAFWDLVHDHESSAGGRTQSRLVLELPHEASARDRHTIVRRYVEEFEQKGIPYWASIHEPTKKNDARNYHAHIVFTDRPMKQMIHPETGEIAWDFTIRIDYKNATRHTRSHFPYRQNRDPEMRSRSYIKASRERFANIVNDVMVASGVGVRYDPRSYKDMGLDVQPMKNVSRILTDKSKSQQFVYMDEEWTRRMIDLEIQAASIRRDATYQKLLETERQIAEVAADPRKVVQANKKLPPHLRMSPAHTLSRGMARTLTTKMLESERNRLTSQFVDEATERAIKRVIDATTTKTNKRGAAKIYDAKNAPDTEDLKTLHDAAREELAEFHKNRQARHAQYNVENQKLVAAWRAESVIGKSTESTGARPSLPNPPTGTQFHPVDYEPWNASPSPRRTRSEASALASMPFEMRRNQSRSEPLPNDSTLASTTTYTENNQSRPLLRPTHQANHDPLLQRINAAVQAMMPSLENIPPDQMKSVLERALEARIKEHQLATAIVSEMERRAQEQGPPKVVSVEGPRQINRPQPAPSAGRNTTRPNEIPEIRLITPQPPANPGSPPVQRSAKLDQRPALPGLITPETRPLPEQQTIRIRVPSGRAPTKTTVKTTRSGNATDADEQNIQPAQRPPSSTSTPKTDRPSVNQDSMERTPSKSKPANPDALDKTPTPPPAADPFTPKTARQNNTPDSDGEQSAEEKRLAEVRRKRRKAIISRRQKDRGR